MPGIQVTNFDGGKSNITYQNVPKQCPFCHKNITPRIFQGFTKSSFLEIVFQCPDDECGRIFTAFYSKNENNQFAVNSVSIGTFQEEEFSQNIKDLSKSFTEIYNQALKSESLKLNHLTGIGLRKALEFLIKDYLINNNPEKEEKIKKKFLGKCIDEYVDNQNIKEMSVRAAWLGNDETHYIKKWEDKDIGDLKKLIQITLHWIEMELLTKQYKEDMS